jgi:hypothetical protein
MHGGRFDSLRSIPDFLQTVESYSLTPARLFSPAICEFYGLQSLANFALRVTLLLCKTSDISEWCLHYRVDF